MDFCVEKMPLTEENLSNWARFISIGINILRMEDRDKEITRAPLATSTGSIEATPGEFCVMLLSSSVIHASYK